MRPISSGIAIALWLATQASAVDDAVLFQANGWQLHLETFSWTGTQVCTATRLNAHGDRFDIALWDSGQSEVYLFMASDFDSWLHDFQGPAVLRIDAQPWLFNNAEYAPYSVKMGFDSAESAVLFLRQMHQSDELFLMSPSGERAISDWSLYGFEPVLKELARCSRRILAG